MTNPINVLLITADQWRAECLSMARHPVVKTPNLDALASDGVAFRNHFAQCTPCGPSRTSLLTGMYLMNHRSVRNGTPLDARFTNLALEMRRSGYEPELIGYTDTSLDPRLLPPNDPRRRVYSNVMPGFKRLLGGPEDDVEWLRYLAGKGYRIPSDPMDIFKPVKRYRGAARRGQTYPPPCYRAEDSDTAFMTDRAIQTVAMPQRSPWFLHLSLLRPHPPYVVPEPYNSLYHPDDVPEFVQAATPEIEARGHPYTAYMLRHHLKREGLSAGFHPNDERSRRQLRATYYGMITEVDHQIGRLVDALRKSGQYEDTLILMTSDHGDQLWDHWMLGKECHFDQSVRIPLIIRAPGKQADKGRGRAVYQFTENVDLMPTILDIVGAEVPLQCDGRSLRGFLAGRRPRGWRREVHWEIDFRDVVSAGPEKEMKIRFDECTLAVVRDNRYKYVHFTALPALLYDLDNDPGELDNLADNPLHAGEVAEYAQKMLSWRMAHAERAFTGIRNDVERPNSQR